MKPLIVVSKRQDKLSEYISRFIARNSIAPYYVYEIAPIKTEITIEQIRAIKREIVTSITEKRLFIIRTIDNANIEAQNAMLKTLEEKNEENYFILLSENSEKAIPTIRSRSQIVDLDSDERLDISIRKETAEFLDMFENDEGYAFLGGLAISAINREESLIFLDELAIHFHREFKKSNHFLIPLVKKIIQTKNLIQSNNLNPQLAVDGVLINLKTNLRRLRHTKV